MKNNDTYYRAWVFLYMYTALALWLALILMKAVGAIHMHWALVLSGIVWISWTLISFVAIGWGIVYALYLLRRWCRCKKIERRIIRQCKALGFWDAPGILCGRALDLKMLRDYGLNRLPGETDEELRARWRTLIDNTTKGAESDG